MQTGLEPDPGLLASRANVNQNEENFRKFQNLKRKKGPEKSGLFFPQNLIPNKMLSNPNTKNVVFHF